MKGRVHGVYGIAKRVLNDSSASDTTPQPEDLQANVAKDVDSAEES